MRSRERKASLMALSREAVVLNEDGGYTVKGKTLTNERQYCTVRLEEGGYSGTCATFDQSDKKSKTARVRSKSNDVRRHAKS